MSDIRPLTLQEIFDRIWEHFIVQKNPRSMQGTNCVYQDGKGARCAIGIFLLDHEYDVSLENKTLRYMILLAPETKLLLVGSEESLTYRRLTQLTELQKTHDDAEKVVFHCNGQINFTEVPTMEHKLRIFAKEYKLVIKESDHE